MDKKCYVFNKPSGCITARTDPRHKTVMEYFPEDMRNTYFPVGRLDKDTTGMLLITNDGLLNHELMYPDKHVSKKYYFWVYGELGDDKIRKLEEGIDIGRDEVCMTSPCEICVTGRGKYEEFAEIMQTEGCRQVKHNKLTQWVANGYISIHEGRKHQIKRMFRAVQCYVVLLSRTAIGGLELDGELNQGEYRELGQNEIQTLKGNLKNG